MDEGMPPKIDGPAGGKPRHVIRFRVGKSQSASPDTNACSADASVLQSPSTNGGNAKSGQYDVQDAIASKKVDNMDDQTMIIPRRDSNMENDISTTKVDDREPDSDIDGDNTEEDDDIREELDRLYDDLSSLEARKKKNRYWEPTSDEARLLEVKQRIDKLRDRQRTVTTRDIRAAKHTSQCITSFSIDDFPQSGKAETAQIGKRKVPERSATWGSCTTGPAQKKQRMTKGTKILAKSATDYISKSYMGQHQGAGKKKLNNDALKDFGSRRKVPRHAREHLSNIEAVALGRPHIDKTAVKANVAALSAMVRVFGKRAQPWYMSPADDEKMTVEHYRWAVEGMEHPLFHHQILAAGFMTTLETDEGGLGSGLLFDHMGYGKTVETLALVLQNPPKSRAKKESGDQITLVVCPKSAARQWVEETKNHCANLCVLQWGPNLEVQLPNVHMVVVVSYSQLATAHNYKTVRNTRKKSKLFTMEFHRIILDEIHEIKSPRLDTARFRACSALRAKHYWGLTGTPTPNSILELFPYLKFIRHPGVTTYKAFKDAIVGGKGRKKLSEETRNENLGKLLEPCMLLRTPKHQFLGTALVDLPNAHPTSQEVELGEEERVIYEYIDRYIKEYVGSKPRKSGKNVGNTSWTMLSESALRFRQCAASPLLLERIVKDGIWTNKQIKDMKSEALSRGCEETHFIDFFQRWIREPKDACFYKPQTALGYLTHVQRISERHTCPGCGSWEPKFPQKGTCDHVWCKNCIEKHTESSVAKEPDGEPACLRCQTLLGEIKSTVLLRLEIDPSSPTPSSFGKANAKKPRQPGDDYNGKQPKSASNPKDPRHTNPTLFAHLDSNPETPFPLSAKMRGMVEQISAWQHEAPLDKIIVFTQFIDVNRLMGRALQQRGIEFLYYTGEMDEAEREAARKSFADESVVKVMFVSLRCGGQALNLTCANRVIIADPWWNHCAEEQAICRVYRIGQKKEVYSVRFLAHDTVDDRMHQLQESKLNETRSMLNEFQAYRGKTRKDALTIVMKWAGEVDDSDDEESESEDESVRDEYETDLDEGTVKSEDDKDGEYKP